MKKIIKGIAVLFVVVAVLATFIGCSNTKYSAVGTMEYANQEAIANGSLAVQQGNYLYYVNGADSNTSATTVKDLDWNSKSGVFKKGGIMKAEVNSDGSLKVLGYVVPKMFFSSYQNAGLYVYGSWIYYVTPTQKTDNKGNLSSGVVFMRTSLDGTKTQNIAEVEGFDSPYVYTPNGLIYVVSSSEIHFVSYTDKSVGKNSVVEEKATNVVVNKKEACVFYVTSDENDYIFANNVNVITAAGEKKVIIATDSYYTGTDRDHYYTDLATQFGISLLSYDADSRTLVYTKTAKDSEGKSETVAYKFASEGYTLNVADEVKYASSSLTSVTYYDGIGLVNISSTVLKIYSPMEAGEEVVSDDVTFSAGVTIIKIDGEDIIYGLGNEFYKADLFNADNTINENAVEKRLSDAKYSTTTGTPTVIGDHIYFVNSDESSYLYRVNYKSYTEEPNNITLAKAFAVSGYRTYDYTKEDSKYDDDYIINKDDADLEDKVPAYIADKDLTTYISNHKSDK